MSEPRRNEQNNARRAEREAARQAAHARGETSSVRLPEEGLSTPAIVRAVIDKVRELQPNFHGDYLDLGSGNGELIDRMLREFQVKVRACDYRDDLMTLGNLKVDVADLNKDQLPYPDASFDLVTCTEVIEHLQSHRTALREIARVLRAGGLCVLSTPNILNLRSRLRYLFFGFFNMFGPLQLGDDRHHSTHGHINPVGYFYLVHALSAEGFRDLSVSIDKRQRRSWLALGLLWLPMRLFIRASLRKERTKYHTLDAANAPFVETMNSLDLLLGRTIIVGGRKAGS